MIIVSQDKMKIINFDNITEINISYVKPTNIIAWRNLDENEQTFVNLGTYRTEERAKEVLKEMYNWLMSNDRLNCSELKVEIAKVYALIGQYRIYEMPKV